MAAQPADLDQLWDDFHQVVNMTSRELRDWLHSPPAQGVPGLVPDDPTAQETGRRVVEILAKRKVDLTDDDVNRMRFVVNYVRSRHPEDAGAGDELWRHQLMTIGHDPMKETAFRTRP